MLHRPTLPILELNDVAIHRLILKWDYGSAEQSQLNVTGSSSIIKGVQRGKGFSPCKMRLGDSIIGILPLKIYPYLINRQN